VSTAIEVALARLNRQASVRLRARQADEDLARGLRASASQARVVNRGRWL